MEKSRLALYLGTVFITQGTILFWQVTKMPRYLVYHHLIPLNLLNFWSQLNMENLILLQKLQCCSLYISPHVILTEWMCNELQKSVCSLYFTSLLSNVCGREMLAPFRDRSLVGRRKHPSVWTFLQRTLKSSCNKMLSLVGSKFCHVLTWNDKR